MAEPIQGCVLAAHRNEVVYATSHGPADSRSGEPCAPRTRFQLASVSKHFTAAAVLMLAERQRLALSDPVTRWLPGAAVSWRDITVHDLLCHTSGLGHWSDYPEIDLHRSSPPDEFVEMLGRRPLHSRPGTAYRYSSPGYVLLAQIAERAGNEPYRDLLARAIFGPLGMQQTFAGSPRGREAVACGHDGIEPVPSWELDTVGMGAGDVWSTVADVLRWNDALRDGEVLSAGMRASMFRRQAMFPQDQQGTAYGYGWCLGRLIGQPARWHDGDNAGFVALNAWLTDIDVRCVVLSNQDRTAPEAVYGVLRSVAMIAGSVA